MLKHACYDRFVNCDRREKGGGRFVTVKPCDRGRANSVLRIKAALNVILFIGSIVGTLWRRRVVGYGRHILPEVLKVIVDETILKLAPVFGLTGLDYCFRYISRFLIFYSVIVNLRMLFRL